MIDATPGEPNRCIDIFGFEIRHFIEDLLRRASSQEQIEDIGDADAHAANAGPSATLFRIEGDASLPVSHSAVEDFKQGAVVACTLTDIFGCLKPHNGSPNQRRRPAKRPASVAFGSYTGTLRSDWSNWRTSRRFLTVRTLTAGPAFSIASITLGRETSG